MSRTIHRSNFAESAEMPWSGEDFAGATVTNKQIISYNKNLASIRLFLCFCVVVVVVGVVIVYLYIKVATDFDTYTKIEPEHKLFISA